MRRGRHDREGKGLVCTLSGSRRVDRTRYVCYGKGTNTHRVRRNTRERPSQRPSHLVRQPAEKVSCLGGREGKRKKKEKKKNMYISALKDDFERFFALCKERRDRGRVSIRELYVGKCPLLLLLRLGGPPREYT